MLSRSLLSLRHTVVSHMHNILSKGKRWHEETWNSRSGNWNCLLLQPEQFWSSACFKLLLRKAATGNWPSRCVELDPAKKCYFLFPSYVAKSQITAGKYKKATFTASLLFSSSWNPSLFSCSSPLCKWSACCSSWLSPSSCKESRTKCVSSSLMRSRESRLAVLTVSQLSSSSPSSLSFSDSRS